MTTPPAASPLRAWLMRAAAILFGVLMAYLVIEALFRVQVVAYNLPENLQAVLRDVRAVPWADGRIVPPSLLRPDNYFGTAVRPGAVDDRQLANTGVQFNVTTLNWLDPNSHMGFRVDRPEWQPRWPVDAVIVGDSFSFCFVEWPDCFSEVLARDHNLSIVNLGVPATGSVGHQRVLDTFGLPYEPRIVIWQWYGNDFNDDYDLAVLSGEVKGPPPAPANRVYPDQPLARWLYEHSAIYALARTVALIPNPDNIPRNRIQQGSLDLYYGQQDTFNNFSFEGEPVQSGWPMSQQAILAARDQLAGGGSQLVIVLVPAKEETYQPLLEPALGGDWFSQVSEGRHKMLEFCQQEDLLCLDLTDELSRFAEQGEQVYWPTDIHLNARGNQIAADAIWRFIEEHGLLAQN
jgi:hypothetical protein